jgi:hypothetical protein
MAVAFMSNSREHMLFADAAGAGVAVATWALARRKVSATPGVAASALQAPAAWAVSAKLTNADETVRARLRTEVNRPASGGRSRRPAIDANAAALPAMAGCGAPALALLARNMHRLCEEPVCDSGCGTAKPNSSVNNRT